MNNKPPRRAAPFPIGLALVGCFGFFFATVVGDPDSGNAIVALQNGRNLFGALLVILGGAALIGALGVDRRAWRAPLAIIAVGAMVLPGAAVGAAAAVGLIGWIEHMARVPENADTAA